MTDSDIKLFFDVYFNNFITSISWDEQIHAPAAKEEWIRCLKNCGRSRYQLCIEDDLLFHSFFTHLKEDKSTLSNSQYDLVLSYCRKLYYSQYNEPSLQLRFAKELMWRVLFFSTPAPPIPHFSFPAQAIIRWGCAQVTITKKL